MICNSKYLYKVELVTTSDILQFTKIACKCKGDVFLVNGKHRLNAKSFLGVTLAKISWDEMYVEAEFDCYFDFEKFIR
ncbi:MAG: HPr family phosphocarrier protein [Clostridia bacterium]|nr:HPr family phosphocarrier protein [Clostridia bacterium]